MTTPAPIDSSNTPEPQAPAKYRSLGAAVKANDAEAMVSVLAQLKKEGRFKVEDMTSALLAGASMIKPAVAEILLQEGADVSARTQGYDVAQTALYAKNADLLCFLIEKGHVTANHREIDGETLLMGALQTEQYDLASRLKDLGANLNEVKPLISGGHSALHLAAASGSFQTVIWLLENEVDAEVKDFEGNLASEMVPQMDSKESDFDMDVMFHCIEAYREAVKKQTGFEIPQDMRKMAHMEATPMTAMEAMAKAFQGAANKEKEQVVELKKPKAGF